MPVWFQNTLSAFLFRIVPAAVLVLLSSEPCIAAPWDSVLTQVVTILTSGWARGVAIIAIVLAGLGMMINLFDRRTAIFIVLGVILVFSAPSLVDLLIQAATSPGGG